MIVKETPWIVGQLFAVPHRQRVFVSKWGRGSANTSNKSWDQRGR